MQRAKLTALHQSQIQAYRIAAAKALMEWATTVALPEIHTALHTTVDVYVKSCRSETSAVRPLWRDITSSSTTTTTTSKTATNKKPMPFNEMAMNTIDERAKLAYTQFSATTETSGVNNAGGDEEEEGEEGEVEENEIANVDAGGETEIGHNDDEGREGENDEMEVVATDTTVVTCNSNTTAAVPAKTTSMKAGTVGSKPISKPSPPSKRGGQAPNTSIVANKKTVVTKNKINHPTTSINRNNNMGGRGGSIRGGGSSGRGSNVRIRGSGRI
jgi:hypothetical protein